MKIVRSQTLILLKWLADLEQLVYMKVSEETDDLNNMLSWEIAIRLWTVSALSYDWASLLIQLAIYGFDFVHSV